MSSIEINIGESQVLLIVFPVKSHPVKSEQLSLGSAAPSDLARAMAASMLGPRRN